MNLSATRPLSRGPCLELLPSGETCKRECLRALGWGLRVSDCGALHRSDFPSVRLPGWWRPGARRAQRRELAAQAARSRAWPATRPPSVGDIEALLAADAAFAPPTPADEDDDAQQMLNALLASVRDPSWHAIPDLEPAAAECRTRWYAQSGFHPASEGGTMRHAVAGLLPHAAAPRECDRPAHDGAQLAAWLARHCEEAQQELSVLGVHTLTLFRGYHEPLDRRSPGVAEAVRAGLEQGALRVEDTDPWFPRVCGSCLAEPIVSTIDSWSTSRRDARYWADHRGQFSAIMVAEVKAWAVLSWSAHGLGDDLSTGDQEVLVIGGRGQVRWEFDTVVHPDLIPAASRQLAGRREPFDPGRR